MLPRRRYLNATLPLVATLALTVGVTSVALAHPESEGAHPGGCIVTVEPGSVGVGQQFTVAGNFGGASIFLVEGDGTSPTENATPDATTPAGQSFSVTFVAEASDVGDWTVWGLIEGSECGDADDLTVATLPNTAAERPSWVPAGVIGGALALLTAVGLAWKERAARIG